MTALHEAAAIGDSKTLEYRLRGGEENPEERTGTGEREHLCMWQPQQVCKKSLETIMNLIQSTTFLPQLGLGLGLEEQKKGPCHVL